MNLFRLLEDVGTRYLFTSATHQNIESMRQNIIETLKTNYPNLPQEDYMHLVEREGIVNVELSPKLISDMKIYYPEALI